MTLKTNQVLFVVLYNRAEYFLWQGKNMPFCKKKNGQIAQEGTKSNSHYKSEFSNQNLKLNYFVW